jgi:23S rRNA (adenine2503-C2)-methyltransferase
MGEEGKVHLKNLSLEALHQFVSSLGEKPFRAGQLSHWLYGRGARTFGEMTDLAKGFRQKLEQKAWISGLDPAEVEVAADGTKKYRFLVSDGEAIESVLLPERSHVTLCISTQVGCALGCKFCLTGKRGWVRNLDPAEILDQVIRVRSDLAFPEKLTNIVLMGMGEPLRNFRNVVQALEIIRSPAGLQFSHRRVTLSTAGILPEMLALGSRRNFVKLAVSLNASTSEQRSRLMPINRRYPLEEVLAACRQIPLARREKITFEYVLLREVNDSAEDARRLGRLLRNVAAKINLIPFNEFPGSRFQRPEEERVQRFREILISQHLTATVRQSKGREISAACGQLGGQKMRQKNS